LESILGLLKKFKYAGSDFQQIKFSEEPVCILLFRQNPVAEFMDPLRLKGVKVGLNAGKDEGGGGEVDPVLTQPGHHHLQQAPCRTKARLVKSFFSCSFRS
jgi:hypothetical protein